MSFEIWVGTVNGRGTFVPSHTVKTLPNKIEALAHGQQDAEYWASRGWDLAVCTPNMDGVDESVIRCF